MTSRLHMRIRQKKKKHYDFCFVYSFTSLLDTQGFVYLEFVKYNLGLCRNAMYANLLYSCFKWHGLLPISK